MERILGLPANYRQELSRLISRKLDHAYLSYAAVTDYGVFEQFWRTVSKFVTDGD